MIPLQKINKENWQTWFLLFVDNELNENEKQEVIQFANLHPQLKEELALLKDTKETEDSSICFSKKSSLLKLSDETIINYFDGELCNDDVRWVYPIIQNNIKQVENINQLYLTPDASIVFPDRNKLLKTENQSKRFPLWMKLSIAATIAGLMFGIYFYNNQGQPSGKYLANTIRDNSKKNMLKLDKEYSNLQIRIENKTNPPEKNLSNPASSSVVTARHFSEKKIITAKASPVASKQEPKGKANVLNTSEKEMSVKINSIENKNGTRIFETTNSKSAEMMVTNNESMAETEPLIATNINTSSPMPQPEEIKKGKQFLNRLGNKLKNRTLQLLANDGSDVSIAGFAVNISK